MLRRMEADAGLLVLRLVTGLVLAAHGSRKAFGAFGGAGLAAWTESVAQLGARPARLFAWLAAYGQVLGGVALALGLATPLAAAVLALTMLAAARKSAVHGFWTSEHGIEYPFVLLAAFVALGVAGPGRLSLDAALGVATGGAVTFALAGAAGALLCAPLLLRSGPRA